MMNYTTIPRRTDQNFQEKSMKIAVDAWYIYLQHPTIAYPKHPRRKMVVSLTGWAPYQLKAGANNST